MIGTCRFLGGDGGGRETVIRLTDCEKGYYSISTRGKITRQLEKDIVSISGTGGIVVGGGQNRY